jgi:phosphonate dehydrogenase
MKLQWPLHLAAASYRDTPRMFFEMEDWALETRPRARSIQHYYAERDRTFFTPHLASAVDEVRHRIEAEAAENLIDVLVHSRTPRGASQLAR